MTLYSAINPYPVILNQIGGGLNGGSVYIGVANQDPQTNPLQVYWDAAGTDPAAQPLATIGGYITRAGTPAEAFPAATTYSIRVRDRFGVQVFYAASVNTALTDFIASLATASGAGDVGFSQAEAYAAGTVGKKLQQTLAPEDPPYNATGSGSTDDTAAIQAALDSFGAGGGVLYCRNKYAVSTLTVPDNVTIQGDIISPSQQNVGESLYQVDSLFKVSGTINLGRGASLFGLVIARAGLTLPATTNGQATALVASFAGTAITANDSDGLVSNCVIAGFATAISATLAGDEGRIKLERLLIDCTNGPSITGARDLNSVSDVECWPLLTAHISGVSDDNLQRTGVGFYVGANNEFSQLRNVFLYGYYRGFVFEDTVDIFLMGCSSDFTPVNTNSVYGIEIKGSARGINLNDFHSEAYKVSVYVNSVSANQPVCVITAGRYASTDICVDVQNGYTYMVSPALTAATTLINIGQHNDNVEIINPRIGNCGTALAVAATGFTGQIMVQWGLEFAGVTTLYTIADAYFLAGQVYMSGNNSTTGGAAWINRPMRIGMSGTPEFKLTKTNAAAGYKNFSTYWDGQYWVARVLDDPETGTTTTLCQFNAISNRPGFPALTATTTYANDAAAAAGGVSVGEVYRNGSVMQIRVS